MIQRISQKLKRFLYLLKTVGSARSALEEHVEITERQLRTLKKEIGFLRDGATQDGAPIRVIFLCHNPSLWGKLRSIYFRMVADERFDPVVIAVPHKHDSYEKGKYRDGGMRECLKSADVQFSYGYDEEKNEWVDLQALRPQYVFYQTPYDLFPSQLLASSVSMYAKVCYVPYVGILIYKGAVDNISQPGNFFRYVSYAFMSNQDEADALIKRHSSILSRESVIVTGTPMFDYTLKEEKLGEGAWQLDRQSTKIRVLWTPRWHTRENNSHFFDYKGELFNWASQNQEAELVFRPHSLCFANFAKTGEFTSEECQSMRAEYQKTLNTGIDESGEYENTFMGSDVLVSDMSSMLAEYLVTGKPVIYTHRTNSFNELGSSLAKGFYWVKNFQELKKTLEMLSSGEDPLAEVRKELVSEHFTLQANGACDEIAELIARDRNSKRPEGTITTLTY